MKTDIFDYRLPPDRIAQHPAERREDARLMVLRRREGIVEEAHFRDLPGLLRPPDILAMNDTRVIPARVMARKERTGGSVEVFFLEEARSGEWEVLLRARNPKIGDRFLAGDGDAAIEVVEVLNGGRFRVRVEAGAPVPGLLARYGETPLPPYIRRERPEAADAERYQTVYARHPGAVAAPTAGLHFSEELLLELRRRGIGRAHLTLHVGLGTFRPVEAERVEDHRMDEERYELPEAAVAAIERARAGGGRLVAVGSTCVRVLETVARENGRLRPGRGRSGLFIHPPFPFRAVDAMLTNFHLPRSTLLMMVCAFAGTEVVLDAYHEAVKKGYRFYSYGDAMLIL